MKLCILLSSLLCSIYSFSQVDLKNRELIGKWFANNRDSAFFNDEYLKMYKYTNVEEVHKISLFKKHVFYAEPEKEILGSTENVNLNFERNRGNQWFWFSLNKGSLSDVYVTKTEWEYSNGILRISSEKFIWKFEIKEKGEIEFSNNNSDDPEKLTTDFLLLKRIN